MICVYSVAGLSLTLDKDSYTAPIALRALHSIGGSATVPIAYGDVTDMAPQAERGKMLGPMLSTRNAISILGPIIGDVVAFGDWSVSMDVSCASRHRPGPPGCHGTHHADHIIGIVRIHQTMAVMEGLEQSIVLNREETSGKHALEEGSRPGRLALHAIEGPVTGTLELWLQETSM